MNSWVGCLGQDSNLGPWICNYTLTTRLIGMLWGWWTLLGAKAKLLLFSVKIRIYWLHLIDEQINRPKKMMPSISQAFAKSRFGVYIIIINSIFTSTVPFSSRCIMTVTVGAVVLLPWMPFLTGSPSHLSRLGYPMLKVKNCTAIIPGHW